MAKSNKKRGSSIPNTIKPNLSQVTKYTEEEKISLFKEGKIRQFSNVQKSKKVYTRKAKHKNDYMER